MALTADYNIYQDAAGMSAVIHTGASTIRGTGSLQMKYLSGGSQIITIRKHQPRNFASGRARFLWSTSGGKLGDNHGFVFNLSQEDITGGVGTGYFVSIDNTGSQVAVRLYTLTGGLTTKTTLASSSLLTKPAAPQAFPIEIQWRTDIENLGGVSILVRQGNIANYSTGTLDWSTLLNTTLINYLHATSYHTLSAGEGIAEVAAGVPAGDPALAGYYFDELDVVPYLIGGITT